MSRNSDIKTYFQKLRDKKIVEIVDLDEIANMFVKFNMLAEEQYLSALQIDNRSQRISLLILSIENLSKPIAISEVIPTPLSKWKISDDEFKEYVVKAGSSHEFKQKVMTQYGKVIGKLNYKYWIPDNDVSMLQAIKEWSQHGDATFPYTEKQAARLCKKMEKFLNERIASFYMYKNPKAAKEFVRRIALLRYFDFIEDSNEFIRNIPDGTKTYEELCKFAKNFMPTAKNMNVKMVSVIVADTPEEFLSHLTSNLKDHIFTEKVYQARNNHASEDYSLKNRLLKKIISDGL